MKNKQTKTIKFKNGITHTYTKYPSSRYWERTVGPENARRKIRLHADIVTNGKGETLQNSGKDVHHNNKNKNHNTKFNLKVLDHAQHTAVGKNAKKK